MSFEIYETKSAIIKETGEIIHLPYRNVKPLHNGLILAEDVNGLYGLLNGNLQETVSPQYLDIDCLQPNGLIKVQAQNELWGFLNENCEEIVSPQYL